MARFNVRLGNGQKAKTPKLLAPPPVVKILRPTFYRHHPDSLLGSQATNPPLFPGLKFTIKSDNTELRHWCIIGPSSAGKTTLLNIIRGKHLCVPAWGRQYPWLDSDEIATKDPRLRNVGTAIQYVGFDGEQAIGSQAPQSSYLSARYESRREETDWSVRDYLLGNTELNPSHMGDELVVSPKALARVVKDLRLEDLVDMPVSNLSNGQTRRARIAKALLGNPEVLLLDEPFMGLDPPTLLKLSPLLERLAKKSSPRMVLTLRPQDPIPDWITHIIYVRTNCQVALSGDKEGVLSRLDSYVKDVKSGKLLESSQMPIHVVQEVGRVLTPKGILEKQQATDDQILKLSRDGYPLHDVKQAKAGEPLVEMDGALVAYGSKAVLGNWQQKVDGVDKKGLWWKIRRGERWGIFGPNGSGKTTILSLICSDHPQTYSLPIKLFGRSRLPEPGQLGISIFDIQARIGHSSPEIHNHIPRSLTLRQVLENAWSDTFRGRPKMDEDARQKVEACLRWFEKDLRQGSSSSSDNTNWADDSLFGGLPFSSQRVALFLRAVIKHPDIVILDEAFSGMDEGVRDRCLLFLAHGETKVFSSDLKNVDGKPQVVESEISKTGTVKVGGLNENQALLCISHVKDEIPGSVREWICLPEANTGQPARFGRLNGPIEGDKDRWAEIWGMGMGMGMYKSM